MLSNLIDYNNFSKHPPAKKGTKNGTSYFRRGTGPETRSFPNEDRVLVVVIERGTERVPFE